MTTYICNVCNLYKYKESAGDGELNIEPNTPISKFPEHWRCPICGAAKTALVPFPTKDVKDPFEKYSSTSDENSEKDPKLALVDVRRSSLEKLKGICTVNKICDGQPVRFCMGQKYGQPIGLGGAGKGLGFYANVQALDKIKIKQHIISEHKEPDLTTKIFGKNIEIPVLASSLSGVKASMGGNMDEIEFAHSVLQGCKEFGTIGLIGNTSDDGQELTGVNAVKDIGVGIPIFKPQKNERLLELIKMSEAAGAIAVGVDLDGVGSTNWERAGKPVYRKTVAQLRELVDATELPFIAKSIMSVEDALLALDAGVSAIDVSNHGGRILDSTRGVAEVLPGIVKAVKGKAIITAGGGVRTGFDVLKILALGANGVLIGRDIVRATLGAGALGVRLHLEYLKSDLRRGMLLTSSNQIQDINEKILDMSD